MYKVFKDTKGEYTVIRWQDTKYRLFSFERLSNDEYQVTTHNGCVFFVSRNNNGIFELTRNEAMKITADTILRMNAILFQINSGEISEDVFYVAKR